MSKAFPLHLIMTENSSYNRSHLKRRLLKEGILKNECAFEDCPTRNLQNWRGRELTLHIDHINGVSNDHRLENLRLLCPNCHSQTDTFAGKNIKTFKPRKALIECPCGKLTRTGNCQRCCRKVPRGKKLVWPSPSYILKELETTSYVMLGKRLGVSDNAIRKYLKKHNQ